jgi:hypothetical protein
MAWDVNHLYGYLLFLTDKNQESTISPSDFFYVWNSEQSSYHRDLLGRWQNRNNTKTGQNTGLIQDATYLIDLAPFTLKTTLTVTAGYAAFPSDYAYHGALTINEQPVFHFNKDTRTAIIASVIDPPSLTDQNYYYTEFNNGYEFLPSTITSAVLDYIAFPIDVVWGFVPDSNGQEVYDPTTSIQPQWHQDTLVEITRRTLKQLGVAFKEADFAQYGQSVISTGD